jgi:hypothetical protein
MALSHPRPSALPERMATPQQQHVAQAGAAPAQYAVEQP